MPEYLMRRTDGVVGLLERLIEDGCQEAMDSGRELLDENLLDEIILSLDDPDRDLQAGEAPPISGSSSSARPAPATHARTPSSTTAAPSAQGDEPPMPRPLEPLPRALAPLLGEGLPGLVLRLARRLDLPPSQALTRTGILDAASPYSPDRLLLTLDERLPAFAHATQHRGGRRRSLRGLAVRGGLSLAPQTRSTNRARRRHAAAVCFASAESGERRPLGTASAIRSAAAPPDGGPGIAARITSASGACTVVRDYCPGGGS
ncbi:MULTISPECIES: hypothetical protein [Streptomyces]|uniref:Uncharacterized protein n=2 Tax=Streptomyces TaxID=1883 RepID=A0ABV9J6L9_9ACTN